MWNDKVIFALDQDGEEHEVKYSDIVSYNESEVNEGKSGVNTFLANIANDYQFDKKHDHYSGFLNTEPSDMGDDAIEFINNVDKYKSLMKKHGLSLEPGYSDDEAIFIKESEVNEAKFKIGDRVSVLGKSSKKPFDSGEVTGIQKDGTILINGLETISHEVAIDAELVVKESVVTESKLTWDSLKESLGINEGRSINKVSKDLEKTVLDMKKTVDEWKEAEGDRKSELLEKLRELNKRKAELEAELNDAVAGKDHDLQLALKEAEELAYLELDVKNIFENEQA
jgi:hypothetical protein